MKTGCDKNCLETIDFFNRLIDEPGIVNKSVLEAPNYPGNGMEWLPMSVTAPFLGEACTPVLKGNKAFTYLLEFT